MLKVYTGNRLDNLLRQMDSNICESTASPLAKIPICIQTPGMQRWIGIKLAEYTGISANLDFIFPGALMKRLTGVKAGESSSWLEKQELVWNVFEKLLTLPEKPVYQQIRTYLEDDKTGTKALRLARRIADVFDQYQIYRPEMVMDWLKPNSSNLPSDERDLWQVEMLGSIFTTSSKCKTNVFHKFIKDCYKGKIDNEVLKSPIHIFGISVMPNFFIEMLRAASKYTDIYFYLLSPTRGYWGDSKTVREKRRLEKIHQKSAEELYIEEKHELLDNLGVIGRDFFDHIFGSDDEFDDEQDFYDIEKKSVLNTIQSEILDLEYGNETLKNDNSIIINNCHNPLREMETLYDHLLDAFNSDSDLKPSDILVMTTDIEKYSPYIKAVFDNPYSEKERIPYSIADISERSSSKPASLFLELLNTIRGDFSLADVIRLLSFEDISEKFSIAQSDLQALAEVLHKSGAFWGHNEEQLSDQGLNVNDSFTWQKAIRRIALGLAEGNTGNTYFDTAAKNVPFSLSEQLGGLMHFADLASQFAGKLKEKRSVPDWCALMAEISEAFISETKDNIDDILYLNKCIANINTESEKGNFTTNIYAEPFIERVTEVLSETKGAKGFISGKVTFCAMLPMRSIPFDVICVAGLDENTFPRQKSSLEFDLMAKRPKAGDRNNRDSDRYLFLETLISAKKKLILSYIGQSQKDNAELPPSTLITELTSHIKTRFGIDSIIKKHKLHSFSKDYFSDGELFTYSAERYQTHLDFSGEKRMSEFAKDDIEAEIPESIDISELERFMISPPDYFVKTVLGLRPDTLEDSLPETEVMHVDSLMKYKLADDSLTETLSSDQSSDTLEYLYKTAQIPPEELGNYHIADTKKTSSNLADQVYEVLKSKPESRNIEITVDDTKITGVINGVSGGQYVYAKPSSLKPKDLIRGWVKHLILNYSQPTSTTLIGADSKFEFAPADSSLLSELIRNFKEVYNKPHQFHITDGVKVLKPPKGIKEDKNNKFTNSYSSRICFGENLYVDINDTNKLLEGLYKHLEGQNGKN